MCDTDHPCMCNVCLGARDAELARVRITGPDAVEMCRAAAWMRSRSEELLRQRNARRAAADCMRNATAKELTDAAQLSQTTTGREFKAMTVKAARKSADADSHIAGKLDAEAQILSAWADRFERIAGVAHP